jgi:hypothetical protein
MAQRCQLPSPRQSYRNPVLLLNRDLLVYSSRGHDGSQVHLGFPAVLSMTPLARRRAQNFLTRCSSKFCGVQCCRTVGSRGTRIIYGMVPGGFHTSASSSILPPETQHNGTHASSSLMTIGSSNVSPPPRGVGNCAPAWLCFTDTTLPRRGCIPCDCLLTGEAGLHNPSGSGSCGSSFSRAW